MTPHTRYCSHYSSYSVTTTMHPHTQIHIDAHSTASPTPPSPPPIKPRPQTQLNTKRVSFPSPPRAKLWPPAGE